MRTSVLITFFLALLCLPSSGFSTETMPSHDNTKVMTNSDHGKSTSTESDEHDEHGPRAAYNAEHNDIFPKALSSYHDHGKSVGEQLAGRIKAEPLNLIASLIFLLAIMHTFVASKFTHAAHVAEEKHAEKVKAQKESSPNYEGEVTHQVSFKAEIFHFLGEVEAVFGIWVIALFGAIGYFKGFHVPIEYVSDVNYTEPMFVVVIMALAATRPITQLSEKFLQVFANLLGGGTAAWWLTILTIAPLLGSFITEPGAMTIGALLLAKQFYEKNPSSKFKYATIGLLFVNISVGGTLTHFAAPPVLMVASVWNWDMTFMMTHFGWKAAVGIVINNLIYFSIFKKEFAGLDAESKKQQDSPNQTLHWDERADHVPAWIMLFHVFCMMWTVYNAHHPALFIGGFLFFIGFHQATAHHQHKLDLKPAVLVGFFLAGLVTHGGLQGWWIQPVLSSLGEVPLMLGATFLTAFNDNAAITYLSTLVPNFSPELKYAVVAGAVTGGGLTVIANAPNPAGQSILNRFFPDGVVPLYLATAALIPTIVVGLAFMLLG